MKISVIHSFYPLDMSHFFVISAMAAESCSRDPLALPFLLNNLSLPKVTFVVHLFQVLSSH